MILTEGLGGALGPISRYTFKLLFNSMVGLSFWIAIISLNAAESSYLLVSVSLSLSGFYAGFLLLCLFMGQG